METFSLIFEIFEIEVFDLKENFDVNKDKSLI